MKKKIICIGIISMFLLINIANVSALEETGYINISPKDAKEMMDSGLGVVVLDVRTLEEYDSVHIDGAISVPFSDCSPCFLGRVKEYMEKNIIVYSESGKKSRLASELLVNNGFKNVYNMKGEINTWMDAGFYVVRSSTIENDDSEGFPYYLGAIPIPDDYDIPPEPTGHAGYVPSSFDWRDAALDENGYGVPGNGCGEDWATSVKSQSTCGSCWDFAAHGALEAVINIRENNPTLDLDLSEQYILSCSNAGSCRGGFALEVFRWMEDTDKGALLESCFPYQANDGVPCSDKCDDWESKLIPINDFDGDGISYGRWKNPSRDFLKEMIIEKGPLVTVFQVYDDFSGYTGGVYEFDSNNYAGLHEMVIVGYNDTPNEDYEGYYICKNSWGTWWGENGWCNIEYTCLERYYAWDVCYVEYNSTKIPNLITDAEIDTINVHCPDQQFRKYQLPNNDVNFYGTAIGGTEPYSWYWDFGDGTTSNEQTKQNPKHLYTEVGEYFVTLTVTDKNENSDTWLGQLLIDSPPEKPTIEGPTSGNAGTEYTYTVVATDPDEDDIKFYISWDLFDKIETKFYPSGGIVSIDHMWQGEGTYIILVAAIDEHNIPGERATLEVSMPINKAYINTAFMQFLENFFERYPNVFPILQTILQRSGL